MVALVELEMEAVEEDAVASNGVYEEERAVIEMDYGEEEGVGVGMDESDEKALLAQQLTFAGMGK